MPESGIWTCFSHQGRGTVLDLIKGMLIKGISLIWRGEIVKLEKPG